MWKTGKEKSTNALLVSDNHLWYCWYVMREIHIINARWSHQGGHKKIRHTNTNLEYLAQLMMIMMSFCSPIWIFFLHGSPTATPVPIWMWMIGNLREINTVPIGGGIFSHLWKRTTIVISINSYPIFIFFLWGDAWEWEMASELAEECTSRVLHQKSLSRSNRFIWHSSADHSFRFVRRSMNLWGFAIFKILLLWWIILQMWTHTFLWVCDYRLDYYC